MQCSECSKLSIQTGSKKCKNCKSDIYDNLSAICNKCSSRDLVCSICLKKVYVNLNAKPSIARPGGCSSCRKR